MSNDAIVGDVVDVAIVDSAAIAGFVSVSVTVLAATVCDEVTPNFCLDEASCTAIEGATWTGTSCISTLPATGGDGAAMDPQGNPIVGVTFNGGASTTDANAVIIRADGNATVVATGPVTVDGRITFNDELVGQSVDLFVVVGYTQAYNTPTFLWFNRPAMVDEGAYATTTVEWTLFSGIPSIVKIGSHTVSVDAMSVYIPIFSDTIDPSLLPGTFNFYIVYKTEDGTLVLNSTPISVTLGKYWL